MHLNCHSHFSFRYGLMPPSALVEAARQWGLPGMALTDINCTSGMLDYVRRCQDAGLRPVVGVDFRTGAHQHFVALAVDNEGLMAINLHLTAFLLQKGGPPQPLHHPHVIVIYPFGQVPDRALGPDEYIGVRPYDLTRVRFSPHWRTHRQRMVAMAPSTLPDAKAFYTHCLLRAMDLNTLLSKLVPTDVCHRDDVLPPPDALHRTYAEYPDMLVRADELLGRCEVHFAFGTDQEHNNLRTFSGSVAGDREILLRLCHDGLPYRYGADPGPDIMARLEKEVDLITQKGFLSYFLINHDMCRYAHNKGYMHVGRGSGANSMVAYLLRITDVDPIGLDLYFERFMNLYRRNPPDFDIDFSHLDRNDVTRYLFSRYPNTALLAVYSTFQTRAALRELGKVYGLPAAEIDSLSDEGTDPAALDARSRKVLHYARAIHDMPSHLSVHSSGIIISERPIAWYTATSLPPKGFPITHFSMEEAEDAGLYKFDVLAQRGLGKIKDAVLMVNGGQGGNAGAGGDDAAVRHIDIHDIKRFIEDEKIKELLREGRAIGCFYVESPAMRMLLKKLRVDTYLGLVAASSVIRPGVSQSGMMQEYIKRFRDPEERKKAHPVLAQIMPDTFGVMVYQEDVIKVAHLFAGLDLGEADVLRRGMSGKFRGREEFARVQRRFFEGCRQLGRTDADAREVWRQIESFAGYAFAKGHSASYAVESYQSLYLKAHHPLAYMVATLNNGGGFYRPEFYVHEARLHGASIEPPCVATGHGHCTLRGTTIVLGMQMLLNLSGDTVREIVESREKDGPFTGLDNLLDRTTMGLEQAQVLIRADALRSFGIPKRQLLWQAHLRFGLQRPAPVQPRLFADERRQFVMPALTSTQLEDAFDQMELLGFPLCDPFLLARDPLPQGVVVRNLPELVGKEVEAVGYVVTVKRTATRNGQLMYFGTFIDREGYFLDTVHFPQVALSHPYRGRGLYHIKGRVAVEFGYHSIEVTAFDRLALMPDPRLVD
jgi:DNA polymerase-3 subunit alpha